ncbi:MAG TPA: NADH-quinone oxidoreductase subunit L [Vicinamibacterales bacterium]|nr:NADH-quinone oxidoreductase subunit L [Vicinamibacterales bacterium]
MDLIWLIPLLPALGAAINGVVGIRAFNKRMSGLLACSTMLGAFALSANAFWELLALPSEAREHVVTLGDWIPAIPLATANGIGSFQIPWAFRLDPLSAMMLLIVTGIGLLIHVYSTAYMHDEPRGGYARFFCYLNLFCFFMLTLVLGSTFLTMFVGWEGVGLCSYLLIGYWYEKKSASDAGKKAFLVNRVGDWGFVLGVFLAYYTFGTLDFRAIANHAATMPIETAQFGVLSTICLLLFVGATGKSAQIPLYVWLPDAMEGPTPVSALIHAATMVTAGVYMVGRNAVLFSHAPMVAMVIMIIGALTALMAASIGLVQYDIKRVLAYSTVSQLGYMFLAMGVGAYATSRGWTLIGIAAFTAGAFHLMTHAFFKALLFLGSGSVIHAMGGEQDMRKMGGLKRYMPVTYITMMIGTLAIAGIPPLAGFFSKDEILFRTFLANKPLWVLAVLTALMTAFYMFRLMSMTFLGGYRGPAWEHAQPAAVHAAAAHGVPHPADAHAHGQANKHDHEVTHGPADDDHGGHGHGHGAWHGPHESPSAMTYPLMALAVGALVAGFVGISPAICCTNEIEHFMEPSFTAAHGEAVPGAMAEAAAAPAAAAAEPQAEAEAEGAGPHVSRMFELGLMLFSVVIAVIGIMTAYRFYVRAPEIADRLRERWSGAHAVLSNKYYVDELYNATFVKGTMASAFGLWGFDRRVVDGAVNGSGWLTVFASWVSSLIDKYIVDGAVNLVGRSAEESSFVFRRVQTGLIQNYALLMLFGVFAFVSIYLLVR